MTWRQPHLSQHQGLVGHRPDRHPRITEEMNKSHASVPADGEANLRAGRPTVMKNMSVRQTTAVLRMPTRDTAISDGSLSLRLSDRGRADLLESFQQVESVPIAQRTARVSCVRSSIPQRGSPPHPGDIPCHRPTEEAEQVKQCARSHRSRDQMKASRRAVLQWSRSR